ncbi:hypothetical protein THIOM_001416 [Candidatus Thiomargarita nelsonii]|uniref:Uncharacterized protein n=1 Tax=Candidatus Thiomargarita nelsonii TaxID=1003181 RepID=A0A176S427_9GAMM|nr:hypothetical protein THIOM_001416 [Candidatus Thiomargarita nelsonii]
MKPRPTCPISDNKKRFKPAPTPKANKRAEPIISLIKRSTSCSLPIYYTKILITIYMLI